METVRTSLQLSRMHCNVQHIQFTSSFRPSFPSLGSPSFYGHALHTTQSQ